MRIRIDGSSRRAGLGLPRADCDGIAYEIPEDQGEIPGISVSDAPYTDAM